MVHNRKRDTHARLLAYRARHGRGAFARIAAASGGALTIGRIMDMYNAYPQPPICWALLRKALDRLDQEAADG